MDTQSFIIPLKQRLSLDLPGKPAQQRFLANPRTTVTFPNRENESIPSAVLILLFPKDDDMHFFLTERTHTVEFHKGQISLPGGAQEKNESLEATALRETYEEIGVHPDKVEIVGSLTPLFTPVTGFMIHPFISYTSHEPDTAVQESEVASVHTVSVNELLNIESEKREERIIRNMEVDVPYFQFNTVQVWGVTSMILSEFKTVLTEALYAENRH